MRAKLAARRVRVKRRYIGLVQQQDVEIRRNPRLRTRVKAFPAGGRIVVEVPTGLSDAEVEDSVARVLARFTAKQAKPSEVDLHRRAERLAALHLVPVVGDLPHYEIRWVTNQEHRWGSCTPGRGTIRISHRVRNFPPYVQDLVVLHELAHLIERQHNDRFWRLVRALPGFERATGFLEGYQIAAGWEPANA